MTIVDWLVGPFALPFMQRPLLVMLALAVALGLASVMVTLRGLQFVGDGLVHAVFPGIVVGFAVAGRDGLVPGGLVAAAIAAVAFTLLSRRALASDSAIAVVLTLMFGIGVIVVSRQSDYVGQLQELLFGRLLTVTDADVTLTLVIGAAATVAIALVWRTQLFRAHDPLAARASGHHVLATDLVLAVSVAVLIVAATAAVGNLLALGLLVVPGAAARLLTHRIGWMVTISIATAALAGYAGLLIGFRASVDYGIPLAGGASVITTLVVIYGLVLAASALHRHGPRTRPAADARPASRASVTAPEAVR
ncbi:manganese/iron transport system permease protein [Microcella putealis]|uniref:Manganese/iron transport system permease protein n=1 Tax=Microcella putealis TaxID=337005 RepID=A0A4Q7LN78_9MICO|nr:metal ABC transporter permease [Microcella putealis]RZS56206.1 manganese/iron transport system permease protein [Microcella putealis]TQM27308.1 manganese/iron transport system permease protein [Microcella putealis]